MADVKTDVENVAEFGDVTAAVSDPVTEGANPEEIVGEPDGTIIGAEKVVYDYDAAGTFVGWHKEEVTA